MSQVFASLRENLVTAPLGLFVIAPLSILANEKLTFSAGLLYKVGEYCYAVQGELPSNDVYRENRLLQSL